MSKCWTYSAGAKPNTVTVYERESGGPLYARAWGATSKQFVRKSLGHKDKTKAKRYAIDQAAKLQKGEKDLTEQRINLAQVFALYEQHRVGKTKKGKTKSEHSQWNDIRCIELWTRVLGGNIDPHSVRLQHWEAFRDARFSGAIDARGNAVEEGKRKPVRTRPVEYDMKWLKYVFNWAVTWRLENGSYLMRENPVRGYTIPTEDNKRRPVATQDRFELVRQAAEKHTYRAGWLGKRETRRSYLPELLDIVNGTGRRISAICKLTFEDVRLERTKNAPYGVIRWPADTDKTNRETIVPISPEVRRAIDRVIRQRPSIGKTPLFPSPVDPSKPLASSLADRWLREAERIAELEPLEGSLWHAYRRKWATERKHLPDVDVAAAGGWKDTQALKQCYQHADAETMLTVVLSAGELREAK